MGPPLVRCFLRAAVPPALATGALAWVLLSIAGLGQALLATSAAPGPQLLGQLALAVLGSTAGLALGVAALAGAAGAVSRLREEGALVALAAAGLPPGRVAWLALGFALPLASASLLVAHEAEPRARALVRDTRALAAASVAPGEGETVRLGTWWLGVSNGRLHFTDGESRGSAGRWSLEPRAGGVLVALDDAEIESGSLRASAGHLLLPIALRGARVHVSELTSAALSRQLAVSASLGRDGYERWICHKRTLLAAILPLLSVLAAGLARRFSPGLGVGATLLGAWALVRVLDGTLGPRDPWLAGALLLGAALAALVPAWR